MTVRLNNPTLDDTATLLSEILLVVLKDGERALFLTPAGEGAAILQRLRVMISRKRNAMKAQGRKVKEFRLRSTIHPETHNGKRHDACVCWVEVSITTQMRQILEDQFAI